MALPRLLLLFGAGFLVANARAVFMFLRDLAAPAREALAAWPAPRPPFYGLQVGIAVALGLLIAYNLLVRLPAPETLFGEGMMFLYYAGAVPLTARIRCGLYRDGIWTDRGFVSYGWVGGLAWREGTSPVLLAAGRDRRTARPLTVPGAQYGAVRRLLRDLIADHTIRLSGHGLDLGARDEREDA